jgi:hypothetical protein
VGPLVTGQIHWTWDRDKGQLTFAKADNPRTL